MLPFLLLPLLAQAYPQVMAMDEGGVLREHLREQRDSLCSVEECVPTNSQTSRAEQGDSAQTLAFLRESARKLSAQGLHGSAFQALDLARKRGGPQDSLRLEQAMELFLGGQTEAALGLSYTMEKRFPLLRTAILMQRIGFFQELGMEEDALATQAQLPKEARPESTTSPSNGIDFSGWYNFTWTDTRIHYAAVPSRLLALTKAVQGQAILGTDGLDTLRADGTTKDHSFGVGLLWNQGLRTLRIHPWMRAQLDGREDSLLQWGGGTRIGSEWPLPAGRLMAGLSLNRTLVRPEAVRQSTEFSLGWNQTRGAWPWSVTSTAALGSTLDAPNEEAVRYRSISVGGKVRHPLPGRTSLHASSEFSALFSPAAISVDSFAHVVEVSGMRDTILNGSLHGAKPNWLSIYNPATNAWNWNPGLRTLQTAPSTLQHGLDFRQVTPASHVTTQASLGADWRALDHLTFSSSGTLRWMVWLERSRWNLTELGRNASGDTLTLWHNREDDHWYLVEPLSEDAFERRIIPMESFSRRRQDLDMTLELSGTLELGLLGTLEGQWIMEHNWSNVDDKDADRNVWDLRAFAMSWSLVF